MPQRRPWDFRCMKLFLRTYKSPTRHKYNILYSTLTLSLMERERLLDTDYPLTFKGRVRVGMGVLAIIAVEEKQ